ncbi:MAG: hypothetical protein ACK4F9_06090 [Brevinematia bacterium]
MKRSILVLIVILIVRICIAGEVKSEIDSFFSTPRQLSLGDVRLLYPYDSLVFLNNPSILSYASNSSFFLTKISFYVGARAGYLYDTMGLASYNLSPREWLGFDWNVLTNNLLNDPYGVFLNSEPEIALLGPILVGYVGNGIGILLFNDFFSSLDVRQAPGIPYVDLKTFAEVGITFGFGTYFDILKFYTLHVGLSFSYSKRYKSPFFYGASVLEVVNYYEKVRNGIYEYDVGDSVWGDIGFILDDGGYFRYALTINDFFGRTFYWNRFSYSNGKEVFKDYSYVSYIFPSVSLGIIFHLEKIPYIPTFLISDFMVELNLVDVFNFGELWFKKVKLGSEVSILRIIKLRGGANQGYLTFGLGIDLKYVVVDIGVSQYEKGFLPGHQAIQNISASTEIKF